MRTHGVVILPPRLNNPSCLGQREESLGIQALFPKPAIEAFDVAVFRRLAGMDELQPYSPPMRPQGKRSIRPFLRRLNFLSWFIPQEDDHDHISSRGMLREGGILD